MDATSKASACTAREEETFILSFLFVMPVWQRITLYNIRVEEHPALTCHHRVIAVTLPPHNKGEGNED
ncbi:protein of unknown function [Enterobacter cancerogenus]|nr:protein of unknown function [Enterobacter cancerogenus]